MNQKEIAKAKQKAKEIYFAMLNAGKGITSEYHAQECALIAINEIIEATSYAIFWEEVRRQFQKMQ